jgi:hypothetical protein
MQPCDGQAPGRGGNRHELVRAGVHLIARHRLPREAALDGLDAGHPLAEQL